MPSAAGSKLSAAVLTLATTGTRPGRTRSGKRRPPARIGKAFGQRLLRRDERPAGIAHREVSFSRRHGRRRTPDLDLDGAKAPVVVVVGRNVSNQVVVALIALDAVEPLTQIVCVVEREASGVVRQTGEAGARILAEHVFVFLEALRQRRVARSARGRISGVDARFRRLVHLVADLRLLALGPQPGRIHRVNTHVGPVGGVDNALEQPLHGGRNRHPFRKEHQALASGEAAKRVDRREEAIRGRIALLIAGHHFEVARHFQLHLGKDRVAGRAAGGLGGAGPAGGFDARQRLLCCRALVGCGSLTLRVGTVEACRAAAGNLVQRLPQRLAAARERRVRVERQIDAEDTDVVRRTLVPAERLLCRPHRQLPRVGTEPVEHKGGHSRRGADRRWRSDARRRRGRHRRGNRRGGPNGPVEHPCKRADVLRDPVLEYLEFG